MFNNIKNDIVFKECNINEIIAGNPLLNKSSKMPNKREDFFNDINNMNINDLVKKYVYRRFKIKRILSKIIKSDLYKKFRHLNERNLRKK